MERTILHCDLNSFFASVELLSLPELRNKPMAVCGNSENRQGIILAKNDIAKKFGVTTAEANWQAQKKCPDLVIVPPHYDKYYAYSKLANEIYESFTDMVEPFGIDESWLDLTGSLHLFENNGQAIADKIRETIKSKLELTVSVGVSFNKVFSKLGSDYKKPDATTVINRDNYKKIVYPQPVSDLLYVGKVATDKLAKIGVHTIGQLAELDRKIVISFLGKMGEMVHDYANGIDNSAVKFATEQRDIKSVGNGMTFKRNLEGFDDIKAGVAALADTVAMRLRKHGTKCQTIQVMIKDPYLRTISRQKTFEKATHSTKKINDIAIEIIQSSWNIKAPIRMLTITAMGILPENESDNEQLTFFDEVSKTKVKEKQEKLEIIADNIRDKFGKGSISFGSSVKNDLGIDIKESDSE
jgi:DNA polymerase-4